MRALFTCFPQFGHFLPLTSIARALVDAGHEVAIGTTRMLQPAVEAVGLRWVRAGIEHDDPEMAPVMAQVRALRGRKQSQCFVGRISGDLRPRRMVPDLLEIAETWRPDVFIRDSNELGALIASELLGVPHATVLVNATGALRHQMSALYDPIQQVRASFGLPERSTRALMEQYLTLIPFPPSLNAVDDPVPATAHHFRGLPPDAVDASLPTWVETLGSRPLVYLSLGM